MANFAYAGPAVQGGGSSWQSNNAAYSQQANRPQLGGQYASPGGNYAYSGPAVGNGGWQQNYQQLTGRPGFQQQAPQQQARPVDHGYHPASDPRIENVGAGGGIPGSRFGQMGAAYNPQTNTSGISYAYQNPQTGQKYDMTSVIQKMQQANQPNLQSIYQNALRQRPAGLGGLTSFTPGFYGY